MSVFDPSLDRTPELAGRLRTTASMAMLRHDLSGALAGIAGGVGQIASFDLDPRLRAQLDRIAASASAGMAPCHRARRRPRSRDPAGRPTSTALIGHLRHRFAGEPRGAARHSGSRWTRGCRRASGSIDCR